MIKAKELLRPNSCWNKAKEDELVFVLLARDSAAPLAVRAWINERLKQGLNKPDDPQIKEAEEWIKEASRYQMAHFLADCLTTPGDSKLNKDDLK